MRKMSIVSNGLEWEGVVVRKVFGDEEGMGKVKSQEWGPDCMQSFTYSWLCEIGYNRVTAEWFWRGGDAFLAFVATVTVSAVGSIGAANTMGFESQQGSQQWKQGGGVLGIMGRRRTLGRSVGLGVLRDGLRRGWDGRK
jgi:hypothetical protein